MKKLQSFLLMSILLVLSVAFKGDKMLEIGTNAPMQDYSMYDVASATDVTLSHLEKENGLLVIFTANTCPFVLGWEEEYPRLGDLTAKNNLGMVLVNSNEAKRDDADSREAMKKRYEEGKYNTPYVIDVKHQLADAFGAKTTPHVYLFDSEMTLVYRGSINDKYEERGTDASKFYLNDAIEQLVAGQKPNPAETRQIGCSIKRVKQ